MKYFLSVLWLVLYLPLHAQEAVIFTKDTEINLNPYIYYFMDSSGELSVDEVRNYAEGFRRADVEDLRLGVDETVAWLKIRIHNPYNRKEDAVIDFKDPSLYMLTLYQINQDPLYSGTGTPQDRKNIRGNRNAFILSLFSGETRDVLIRVESRNYMTLKAFVEDDEYFFQDAGNEKIFLGFFYGILFLICIYSVILFFLSGFRYFFWYSAYIIVNAFFTGIADGLTPQYFHSLVEWSNGYHGFIIAYLTNVTGLFFLRSYFRPSDWSPLLNRVIIITLWAITLICAGVALWNPDAGFAVLRPIGLITLGIFLWTSAVAARKNITGSMYFLMAFSVFGLFILIFIGNLFRLFPYVHLVQYSVHYGFLLSMIILSCALGVRIYKLYRDYMRREQDKQALIQQKNEELENQVSERTAILAKKESQLRSILDNSINIIWMVNSDYLLLECNTAFEESWKAAYGDELVKGKSILEQYNGPSKDTWKERYDQIFDGQVVRVTEQYQIEGESRSFEILCVPIRNGDAVEFAAVFSTDITERLQYEEQLKKQNIDLRKVNQELDRFVYSASHDLKAPLSSLQGLIGLVKLETDDSIRGQYYMMMEKSIKRLDQFIRDIIDYSRNTRVDLRREKMNIPEMIQSVFDDLHYMEHAADFILESTVAQSVPYYHDETRLRIVLRNLLSNALRYGFKDEGEKKLVISGEVTEEELQLTFRDFGPGIGQEHRENIFKMFYRAHENSEGTGLGLYIVKETLEKMGGSISLDSSEEGTIFTIHVPNMSVS